MKCGACNVDGVSLTNATADVAETRHTTQGQGDTHQIIHAILEPPIESAELTKAIRKEETVNEATTVTIGLLHQLIEELENKTVLVCSKNDTSINKERIANWEEKEEQFIRTIEDNVDNKQEITMETLPENESVGRFRVIELKHEDHEELRSHSSQHVASISRNIGLDEIQLEKCGSNSMSSLKPSHDDTAMEQILAIEDVEKRKTFGESTKKKKRRGLGSRLRKLFRAVFGRQKN